MDSPVALPPWLRQPLIGAGLFLLGGLLAFGYSYRPLHGALSWKVEQLEARIDERNREHLKLGDELARLRSQQAIRVDPATFAQIENELARTKTALAQAEKDRERTDRKRKEANASASRWRKRYEELRDRATVTAASPAPTPSAPASPDVSSRSTAGTAPLVPAAPSPTPPAAMDASPAAPESGMLPNAPAAGTAR